MSGRSREEDGIQQSIVDYSDTFVPEIFVFAITNGANLGGDGGPGNPSDEEQQWRTRGRFGGGSVPSAKFSASKDRDRQRKNELAAREMNHLKRLGLKPGVADLCAMGPAKYTAFFEVKTAIGRLSPGQIEFRARCEKLGHPFYIVRSLDEFRAALEKDGIKTREARGYGF